MGEPFALPYRIVGILCCCFFFVFRKPLRMRPLPPAPHSGRRGTVINDASRVHREAWTADARFALRRGRYVSSSWFTVLSVLPHVPAMHTIEMIPKSMILFKYVFNVHIYFNLFCSVLLFNVIHTIYSSIFYLFIT